ncbi:hypothetical protein QCN29_36195, partial [Streptomyces sp. HNM0663]|nr:hypothetical protein [Streptomyces chengmaiensis]
MPPDDIVRPRPPGAADPGQLRPHCAPPPGETVPPDRSKAAAPGAPTAGAATLTGAASQGDAHTVLELQAAADGHPIPGGCDAGEGSGPAFSASPPSWGDAPDALRAGAARAVSPSSGEAVSPGAARGGAPPVPARTASRAVVRRSLESQDGGSRTVPETEPAAPAAGCSFPSAGLPAAEAHTAPGGCAAHGGPVAPTGAPHRTEAVRGAGAEAAPAGRRGPRAGAGHPAT